MIVKIFRNTYPFHYVIFILMSLFLQIAAILNIDKFYFEMYPNNSIIMNWLSSVNMYLLYGITYATLITSTLAAIHFSQHNLIVSKTSSLPGFIFLCLSACRMLTPEIAASLTIFICLHKLMELSSEKYYPEIYFLSASTMTGLSTLITPNAFYYILVIFLSMYEFKHFNIRYIILTILGYITPLLFYLGISALNGNIDNFIPSLIPEYSLSINFLQFSAMSVSEIIYFILYTILAVVSIFNIYSKMHSQPLVNRKKHILLIFSASIPLISAFFSPNPLSFLTLSIPPVTFLSAIMLSEARRLWQLIIPILMFLSFLLIAF